MKVLVIGGTGGTGRPLVRQLLACGHEVTAWVRRPNAISGEAEGAGDRLRIVEGEARDDASINRAVAGQDAVVVAFAPRSLRRDDLQETLYRNMVGAMRAHGVRRLVNLSAWGLDNDAAIPAPWIFRHVIRPVFLRHIWADKRRGEAIVKASGLEWVNVQPGRLLNEPARGGVRASVDGRGLVPRMNREDLAAFMIEQINRDEWVRRSVVIGY